MKKYIPTVLCVCLLLGCATTKDLQKVHSELDLKIATQKEESANLQKNIENMKNEITALRKSQAELKADITDIKDEIQKLKGATEQFKREIALLKEVKEKLDNTLFKVNFIENFLEIGKKPNHVNSEKTGKGTTKITPQKAKSEKETLYAAAYESFREGKYEKARGEFQNFLKLYPDTEYSDNAQFWIGECYYFENQYEKAILEYEKVVKNYPTGSKVPYALLKQGLSFLNLGDKASARLVLQRVIKEFPNTNQARIARSKLMEIR